MLDIISKYLSRHYVKNHELKFSLPTSKRAAIIRSVDLLMKKSYNFCTYK